MSDVNPTRKFRTSLTKVVELLCEGSHTQLEVQYAWREVSRVFTSPEFTRYRETVGKLSGMMPKSYPGMEDGKNVYWDNFVEFLQYYDASDERLESCRLVEALPYVAGLVTRLSAMELHQDDFDKAFSSNPQRTI